MLKTANETAVMCAGDEAMLEDRKLFVSNYGQLLAQTRERITSAYLDDEDVVHVVYRSGGEKLVNVKHDSYMAIVRDVAKALR